jgi:dihydropteroate synthase
MNELLRCGRFSLALDRPLLMGIVNVTPDSFSDGGRFLDPRAAVAHARELIEQGADILDIGAESTRPGAQPVGAAEEIGRLRPVLDALRDSPVPISVDTMKPEVMRAALDLGAAMINDVAALAAPGALDVVAASDCGVCLMHMQGEPRSMQAAPHYDDVVGEVKAFLAARVEACLRAGIARERIVVDPGLGFGKTVEHNFELLRGLPQLAQLGRPLLVGWSRKSSLGKITGRAPQDRLAASLAAALLALQRGARILRVHDVKETRDVIAVWRAAEKR